MFYVRTWEKHDLTQNVYTTHTRTNMRTEREREREIISKTYLVSTPGNQDELNTVLASSSLVSSSSSLSCIFLFPNTAEFSPTRTLEPINMLVRIKEY